MNDDGQIWQRLKFVLNSYGGLWLFFVVPAVLVALGLWALFFWWIYSISIGAQ